MYEYESSKAEQGKSERELHLTRINTLEADLASAKRELEEYKEAWNSLRSKIDTAEREFKSILAGDMDAEEIVNTYGEVLAEHLDWEFSNEVEVEITVTWRGTVELPIGKSVEDLDIDDFGINEPEHNEYQSYFRGIQDYTIEER